MKLTEAQNYLEQFGLSISPEEFALNGEKTVFCGMSGGVDSSVAALLLKMQGYKTVGLFMRNWEEFDDAGVCSAEEDYADVIKVCEKIDVPYYSVDFVKEYRDNVFKRFLEEYKEGHTPNPDILCNQEIKFKVFYNKARELGADFLATGHYCQKIDRNGVNQLAKGTDRGKDQSYFLYTMQEEVLDRVLFPVGGLPKKSVRKIASDFNLATSQKKDSTGICFIGERNFKKFLGEYIQSQKGNFVHFDTKKVLGPHDGHSFYTIGQRKGLGLGGPGGPWFVVGKNMNSNEVYVVEGDDHPALYAQKLWCDEESWVGETPSFPLKCKAKARYRQKDQDCVVLRDQDGVLRVEFNEPQRALTLRQSVVFYSEEVCLGGAIINKIGPSLYEEQRAKRSSTLDH